MLLSIAPTRKRAVAAARLTSGYGASMALLLAPLLPIVDSVTAGPAFLASPFAAWIAVSFLLFALARRAAFVALWLLGFALWLSQREAFGPGGLESGAGFALWSVLAAPLYLITAVGFGATTLATPLTPARRIARIARTAGIAGWGALLVLGALFPFGFFFSRGCFVVHETTGLAALDAVVAKAWLVVPPLVTLDAIRRVWRGRRVEAWAFQEH